MASKFRSVPAEARGHLGTYTQAAMTAFTPSANVMQAHGIIAGSTCVRTTVFGLQVKPCLVLRINLKTPCTWNHMDVDSRVEDGSHGVSSKESEHGQHANLLHVDITKRV